MHTSFGTKKIYSKYFKVHRMTFQILQYITVPHITVLSPYTVLFAGYTLKQQRYTIYEHYHSTDVTAVFPFIAVRVYSGNVATVVSVYIESTTVNVSDSSVLQKIRGLSGLVLCQL